MQCDSKEPVFSSAGSTEHRIRVDHKGGGDEARLAIEEIEKSFPADPVRQLDALLPKLAIVSALENHGPVKDATYEQLIRTWKKALLDAKRCGKSLHNITDFDAETASAVIRLWEKEVRTPATLQTLASAIRRFCVLLGCHKRLPPLSRLVSDPYRASRKDQLESAIRSRIISDSEDIFARAELVCKMTALHLRLMYVFGIFLEEIAAMRLPADDCGDVLLLSGGERGRAIRIDTPLKRALLDEAKRAAARRHDGSLLVRPRQTLNQMAAHFKKVVKIIKLTREHAGFTASDLRRCRPDASELPSTYLAASKLGAEAGDKPSGNGAKVPKETDAAPRVSPAEDLMRRRRALHEAFRGEPIRGILREAGVTKFVLVGDLALGLPAVFGVCAYVGEPIGVHLALAEALRTTIWVQGVVVVPVDLLPADAPLLEVFVQP